MNRTLSVIICLFALACAGCSHWNGTMMSIFKYGEGKTLCYEIYPGEAGHEWVSLFFSELKPFEDEKAAEALKQKYKNCCREFRKMKESKEDEGEEIAGGIIAKHFSISCLLLNYVENEVTWSERYLFADEGIVRVRCETGAKGPGLIEYYRPEPRFRALLEQLFTDDAQKRYKG